MHQAKTNAQSEELHRKLTKDELFRMLTSKELFVEANGLNNAVHLLVVHHAAQPAVTMDLMKHGEGIEGQTCYDRQPGGNGCSPALHEFAPLPLPLIPEFT